MTALPWTLTLGAAIVYYSYSHKENVLGPYVMGLCRGLVYAVAAVAVARTVTINLIIAALALALYVAALTEVAKRIGPRGGGVMPLLIAGISLVDALVILATGGGPTLAAVATCGFFMTLVFQRVVPGT
jgi:4-hydroxybenzoate polyprenyltransferase